MKILAVDDDPFIRELFPSIFANTDLTDVHTAPSGHAALDAIKAQRKPFDCFLLDVDMPEMDGIELCKRIRTLPGYESKPILMLTAKTDSVSIENAFASGANDYIAKPFNLKDISNRIRVAERLLLNAKTIKRIGKDDIPQNDERGRHDFDHAEKLHLADTNRLILSFSLGNYITQLDRNDLEKCQVFCVAVDESELLFNKTSSKEFLAILSDVGTALTEVIKCPHLLMCYEGAGSFLCITRDPDLPEWDAIEEALQGKLDHRAPIGGDDAPLSITLSVGTPIPPNANRTQRVKKTFERALSRARMRYATKCAAA